MAMSDTSQDAIWLTPEAFEKLSAELAELKTTGRSDVSARIAAAREEGDLSENGGYHAAREEQGQMEGRIRQLEHMLRIAQVGESEGSTDEAALGKVITVAFNGNADHTDTFLLGSREVLAADSSVDHAVSPQAPLGAAVLGKKVNDEVSYEAPNGKTIKVKIISVSDL